MRKNENKKKNQALYNAGLRLINRTYGEVDEWLDIYDIHMNNMYIHNGEEWVSLSSLHPDYRAEVMKDLMTGELRLNDIRIDTEQMIIDLAMNEATDYAIGISSQLKKAGMQGMDIQSR